LLFLLNAAFLAEKQQIPILYSFVWLDHSSYPQSIALEASTLTITLPMRFDWYLHYDLYIWLIYTLRLFHLIDTYTIIDTPDWYIHWVKHPLWLIHTLWVIHPLWLIDPLWFDITTLSYTPTLIDTYTIIDPPGWYIHYDW
jgi:uncharacterized protein with PQ loop repeat